MPEDDFDIYGEDDGYSGGMGPDVSNDRHKLMASDWLNGLVECKWI